MENQNKFTALHRILHWVIALTIPIQFITGFLRMYWMNKNHIVSIIENETINSPLSKEQMVDIAVSIREPMWEWHELFANIVIIAFIARIIYMLVKKARFSNPFTGTLTLKERLKGLTYVYFYLFVFISAVTGIFIEWELLPQWKEGIETIHKWGIYWFPVFILLHFAGIVLAELSNEKGLTSKMIGGD